jgi:ATP-dependent helicase/nuclease subunit B
VLSATDIEDLVRDPYKVYAKRVLGLRGLDRSTPTRACRARQIIHEVLERFVRLEEAGADPMALIMELGRKHFARHEHAPQVRALWWPRFEAVARWFVAEHGARRGRLEALMAEHKGGIEIEAGGGRFRLEARADRIEVGRDGSLAILDYKTGNVPDKREVRSGARPQLLVEALIAAGGGFPGVPAAVPAEILYWGLKGGGDRPDEVGAAGGGGGAAGAARRWRGRDRAAAGALRGPEQRLHRDAAAGDRARPTATTTTWRGVAEWRDGGEGGA